MRLQTPRRQAGAGFGEAKISVSPLNKLRLRILFAADWEPTAAGFLRPGAALAALPEGLRSRAKTVVTLGVHGESAERGGPDRFRRCVLRYVLWLEEHYDLIWATDVSANLPVDTPDYYTRSLEVGNAASDSSGPS